MGDDEPYSRFEIIKPDGSKVKLVVRDMWDSDCEAVCEFMTKWYIHEEALTRAAGIGKSEDATNEFKGLYRAVFQNKVNCPLVCVCENEDSDKGKIVGCNLFLLEEKNQDEPPIKSPEIKRLLHITSTLQKYYDILEKHKVDSQLGGIGLTVDPKYRGCGIAVELLKARLPMMRRRGVTLTSAWFTTPISQKAAKKAGYEEVAEISFELLEKLTGVEFTVKNSTSILLILKV